MVVRSANPGKAVETAALWKAVEKRQESSERPSIHFSTESTALGKRLAVLARFPQLHTASTAGQIDKFGPERSPEPGIGQFACS